MSTVSKARGLVERYFPRAATTYRYVRDLWQSMAPAVRTPFGFSFVGAASMQSGAFEATEVRLVQGLLAECELLVNVGANAGYYCCIAAQAGKRVIAFEPLAENVRLLLRNMQENAFGEQVEVFPLGLGEVPGIVTLFGGGTGASLNEGWAGTAQGQSRLIPVSTADLVLGSRLVGTSCLVIMDIEGAELPALRGSERLLSQQPKPIWMVEIVATENRPDADDFNSDFEDTFELFWSHGYEAWTAEEQPKLLEKEDIGRVRSTNGRTLGVYNYMFVDPAKRPAALTAFSEASIKLS